jgi:hypothetical protein
LIGRIPCFLIPFDFASYFGRTEVILATGLDSLGRIHKIGVINDVVAVEYSHCLMALIFTTATCGTSRRITLRMALRQKPCGRRPGNSLRFGQFDFPADESDEMLHQGRWPIAHTTM